MTYGVNMGEADEAAGALGQYASWSPGGSPSRADIVPVGQQSVGSFRLFTDKGMLKVREGVFGLVMENWLPFTTWLTNRFIGPPPARPAWQSQVWMGDGEDITRFGDNPSRDRAFPYPYEIGAVSGFMPMLDQYSMAWAWGKTPSGPGVLTPVSIPDQASYPNWQKVTG